MYSEWEMTEWTWMQDVWEDLEAMKMETEGAEERRVKANC
jgi:hypothetical protein